MGVTTRTAARWQQAKAHGLVSCAVGLLLATSQAPAQVITTKSAPATQTATAGANQLDAAKKRLSAKLTVATNQLTTQQLKMAKAQLTMVESTAIQQAYILLDIANADYDGHRVRAMRHLDHAVKNLALGTVINGTSAQAKKTLSDDMVKAYYKSIRKKLPQVIEPQALSDAQVISAGQILTQTRAILAANNQRLNLRYVDQALLEILLALEWN